MKLKSHISFFFCFFTAIFLTVFSFRLSGEDASEKIEVALSAAQFAEAITQMNMGEGVPCTLRSVEGVSMENVPDEVVAENVQIRDGFKDKLLGVANILKEAHEEMDRVVENKSTISKGRAREMTAILGEYAVVQWGYGPR